MATHSRGHSAPRYTTPMPPFPPPFPPALAAALAALRVRSWPATREARRILVRGLRGEAREALARWSYDAARGPDGTPPTRDEWAAILGTTAAAMGGERGIRALVPDLEPRPQRRGFAPMPEGELSPSGLRNRRARAKAATGKAFREKYKKA